MITPSEITLYYKGKKKHSRYDEAVRYERQVRVHMDGEFPDKLIKERRPAESVTIQLYREKIYAPITMTSMDKVYTSLQKIRKSPDWQIKYSPDQPKVIAPDETLEYYMEYDFDNYTSFTNYFFNNVFKEYLIDANSIILWVPDNIEKQETEYLEPRPEIFSSYQIFDYKDNEWYLLKSTEKVKYRDSYGDYRDGDVFYYVDDMVIQRFDQTNARGNFDEVMMYEHGLGICPVVSLYGKVFSHSGKTPIYKSRISPMLPELDEAAREYSDLQAEIVQHIHSTVWAYQSQECNKCGGAGVIQSKEAAPIACSTCSGKGILPFNPYENLILRPTAAGENAAPIPPMGYVAKQTDIAKLQDVRVQDHIFRAYSAINFEFLAQTPLNISGTAKEIDRSELNNFVYSIAEDVVRIFDDSYYIVNEYRYKDIIADKMVREEMLPKINVPEKFDIVSETVLADEIRVMKESNMDPIIINAALEEYVNKKFNTDELLRDTVQAALQCNPYSSVSDDNVITRLTNDGINQTDYVLYCNIKKYIERAIEENKDFLNMPLTMKKEVLLKYATDETISQTAAQQVKDLRTVNVVKTVQ